MIRFWKDNNQEKESLKKLEAGLMQAARPKLPIASRKRLKDNLLNSIKNRDQAELFPFALQNLAEKIGETGANLQLPAEMVFKLKQRLLDCLDYKIQFERYRFGLRRNTSLRTLLSSVLLLIFVATSVFVLPFQVSLTFARSTYLTEVSGDVFVLRNSDLIKGRSNFKLEEGDVILTKDSSYVTVHFFDDSLSRLSENTNMQIKRLYEEPFNPVLTQVELFLKQGRIWARVINLIDEESSFTVDTQNIKANVDKKAAFDLSTQSDATQVVVFDNVVDVSPINQPKVTSKAVVAGYQATVNPQVNGVQIEQVSKAQLALNPSSSWFQSNLTRDQEYDQKLVASKEEMIKSDSSSGDLNVSGLADFGAVSVLTNDKIEAKRQDFMTAYRNLRKGETLLAGGHDKAGLILVENFFGAVGLIVKDLPDLRKEDPFNADLLVSLMKEKVSIQLKDFSAFLPGDKLYAAKDVLQEVEILLAGSEVNKATVKLSQAEGKLLEIQQLFKTDQHDLAVEQIKKYKTQIDQFVIQISDSNLAEIQDQLVPLVKQQIQQIKVLTALEQSLDKPEFADLKIQVKSLRENALKKLVDSLRGLPGTIPPELLQQLKDIFDSYLTESSDDEDIIAPVLNMLLRRESLIVTQPADIKVPEKLGVVTIVTVQEASKEAVSVPVAPATPVDVTITTEDKMDPKSDKSQLDPVVPVSKN